MADVLGMFGMRQRKSARIESVMQSVESTCRAYDKGITKCAWLLCALIVWFVVAGLTQVDTVYFVEELHNTTSTAYVPESRSHRRLLHRVIHTMHAACEQDATLDVIVGPQVHVNGKPYLKRVLTICQREDRPHVDMVNPVIAVTGSNYGTCIDEIDGKEKHRQRPYPVTLHSDDSAPYTVLELEEACTILQSLDVLNGIW